VAGICKDWSWLLDSAVVLWVRLYACVDMTLWMSVRTVTLTVDAYNALAASKQEGESFSATVRRLTGSQVLLSAFAGAWKGAPRSKVAEIRDFLRQADQVSERDLRSVAQVVGRRSGGKPR